VVGTRLDRDDTLGQQFFLDLDSSPPIQRLLVIRTGRVQTDMPAEPGANEAPPLALQAGWRSVRGFAPGGDDGRFFP
jgi:hypothetical protein